MRAEKYPELAREFGAKLRNFRHKLAIAIGENKINQDVFGEMFGGYSGRCITSYERGNSPVPSFLLYHIWKSGNSIDAILEEKPISESGKLVARDLYRKSSLAILDEIEEDKDDWLLKEALERAKTFEAGGNKKDPHVSTGKRKVSPRKTSNAKKR